MTYETNERGERLYYCLACLDKGWVHPVIDGKPDYSHVRRCSCKAVISKQQNKYRRSK